jgi:hypothetical protein
MDETQNAVSESNDDSGVSYEIEVEGVAAPSDFDTSHDGGGAAPSSLSTGAAAPSPDAAAMLRSEINELRQQNAQLVGELTPFVVQMRNQQAAAAGRPPLTREQLDTDPNLTPSDMARYFEWQTQQGLHSVAAQVESNTRAILAQERARGEFNAATMGQGQDYESLTNRYVAPLAQNNPAIRELLRHAAPGDPARGEMVFATVCALIDRCGDDLVGGLKAALDGAGAYKRGGAATSQRITDAAQRQADRVFAGRTPATTQKLDAKSMWSLGDDQFRALMKRAGS